MDIVYISVFLPISVINSIKYLLYVNLWWHICRRNSLTTFPLNWLGGLIDVFFAFCNADCTGNFTFLLLPVFGMHANQELIVSGPKPVRVRCFCHLAHWNTNLWNVNEQRKQVVVSVKPIKTDLNALGSLKRVKYVGLL